MKPVQSTGGYALTVVLPCYNEERRLPRTLVALSEYLSNWGISAEILVADDGSKDRTSELARQFGDHCRCITLPHNQGKGAAVRAGMLAARGQVIAFCDADLCYRLGALKTAVNLITSGSAGAVFGARDLAGSRDLVGRPFIRRLASFVFRKITRRLVSRRVTDTQCGLKIFAREAAQDVFSRTTIDGFAFDVEVIYLVEHLGIPFQRIPVELIHEDGSTVSVRRHALPMLRDILGWRLKQALQGVPAARRPATAGASAESLPSESARAA